MGWPDKGVFKYFVRVYKNFRKYRLGRFVLLLLARYDAFGFRDQFKDKPIKTYIDDEGKTCFEGYDLLDGDVDFIMDHIMPEHLKIPPLVENYFTAIFFLMRAFFSINTSMFKIMLDMCSTGLSKKEIGYIARALDGRLLKDGSVEYPHLFDNPGVRDKFKLIIVEEFGESWDLMKGPALKELRDRDKEKKAAKKAANKADKKADKKRIKNKKFKKVKE